MSSFGWYCRLTPVVCILLGTNDIDTSSTEAVFYYFCVVGCRHGRLLGSVLIVNHRCTTSKSMWVLVGCLYYNPCTPGVNVCRWHFYPRDAMLARVFATATCPSVRLSRAGIVSKRRKLASWFLHHLVATRFRFSDTKFHPDILRDSSRSGASNKGGVDKISSFYPRDAMLARVIVIAT